MSWRVVGKNRVFGVETGGIIEDIPPEQAETLLMGGHIARVVEDDEAPSQDMVAEGAPETPKEGD